MSENKFQTKTNNIAQLCYQDPVTHEWIPVTEITPLPITGTGTTPGQPLNIRLIGENGEAADVVLQPDGTYALKVDSEMTLNVDNVTITNVKVGTDGVTDTKLLTTVSGEAFVSSMEMEDNLKNILIELKKSNMYLSYIAGFQC